MAKVYEKYLAEFEQKFGEEAVVTALNAHMAQRERSRAYAEKRKEETKILQAIRKASADPDTAAKLRSINIMV
jgi:hypothetical protein